MHFNILNHGDESRMISHHCHVRHPFRPSKHAVEVQSDPLEEDSIDSTPPYYVRPVYHSADCAIRVNRRVHAKFIERAERSDMEAPDVVSGAETYAVDPFAYIFNRRDDEKLTSRHSRMNFPELYFLKPITGRYAAIDKLSDASTKVRISLDSREKVGEFTERTAKVVGKAAELCGVEHAAPVSELSVKPGLALGSKIHISQAIKTVREATDNFNSIVKNFETNERSFLHPRGNVAFDHEVESWENHAGYLVKDTNNIIREYAKAVIGVSQYIPKPMVEEYVNSGVTRASTKAELALINEDHGLGQLQFKYIRRIEARNEFDDVEFEMLFG